MDKGKTRKQKQIIGDKPPHIALIEYLEGNIFMAKGDPKRAEARYEKAIETDPNIMAAYVALSRLYIQEGKLDQAKNQYETILSKNPNYLAGYMALGTIHEQEQNHDKAEDYYRKALEVNKDFAPAANNLAWILANRGGNIDEALGFAQLAKEKMPKNPAVMDTLGWIYYLKGRYPSAISELADSLELAPDNPTINFHLGMAYFKSKQHSEAKKYLEKALKTDEKSEWAEEARQTLKEMTSSSSSG